MQLAPTVVVFAHVFDVVRDMAFLDGHPALEGDGAEARMSDVIFPGMIGQGTQQFMSGFAKVNDDVQRFANALIEIAERLAPASTVKFRDGIARLGDKATAANVGVGFGVSKMNDDIVNAPAIGTGLVAPHFLRELTQSGLQDRRAESE